ncbi:hypothetical protein vseg_016874 [Gypsophila vaccaria]
MAKKKHRIRSSIKSFFESHTDPAKHEKLKAMREDMEEKKKKILNIVKNGEENDESKSGPLADLIEDFHKQYESLYSHYDHLTGELKNKVRKQHHEKGNGSSSSDSESNSDSDHSPKERGSSNGNLEDEILKATDGLQQELEAARLEVTLLKNKLEAVCNEKDSLGSAYDAVISKLESAETAVEDLKLENGTLSSEKLNLLAEKEVVNSKLEDFVRTEVDLKQRIEELIREKDDLANEKGEAVKMIEEGNQIVDNFKAEVEQLQGEKQSLELQLETIKQDFSRLNLELDSAKQETISLNESMKAVEEENEILSLKISNITDELLRAQETAEEIKAEYNRSKQNLAAQEIEFSSLQQIHDAHTTGASEQIEALEGQNSSLKLELDAVMSEKSNIEERFEIKVIEAGKMVDEISELRAAISQVEVLLREKEDQLSALHEKLENTEKESNFQIDALTAQVGDFKQEVDKLLAERSELEEQLSGISAEASAQVEEFREHISSLERELNTMRAEYREMKVELERKADDIAEYLIQIEGLHEKLSSSDKLLKEYFDEKENLAAKLKDFELEIEKLENHRSGLEDETTTKSNEVTRLREEVQTLEDRTLELEKDVQEKEEENANIRGRLENLENESSSKISAFVMEISSLKLELEAVHALKSELEAQTEKTNQAYVESLKLLELENFELKNKTEDQLMALKELGDIFMNKQEQCEQLESDLRESKADLEKAQKQTKKLAQELSTMAESNDESATELERIIEDLKRDVEEADDEARTALQKTRTIEVQLRLANQKLRVTEQLLTEKEEDFKIAEIKYQEECKLLESKISSLEANNAAYRGMIANISENVINSLAGMESTAKIFEEHNEKLSSRIYSMSEEIQILKHCATEKNTKRDHMEKQLSNLVEQLQNEREQGSLVKQNLSKLEVEAANNKGAYEKLETTLTSLTKTTEEQDALLKRKNEEVKILGEEKRDAIRQLCLWSDNILSRYNELKNKVAKSSLPRRYAR